MRYFTFGHVAGLIVEDEVVCFLKNGFSTILLNILLGGKLLPGRHICLITIGYELLSKENTNQRSADPAAYVNDALICRRPKFIHFMLFSYPLPWILVKNECASWLSFTNNAFNTVVQPMLYKDEIEGGCFNFMGTNVVLWIFFF